MASYTLDKDETIALVDDTTTPGSQTAVTKLVVGAGWDQTGGMEGGRLARRFKREVGVDLDLIGIACQGTSPKRYAGGDTLDPLRGAVVHTGDNTTGKGDGDDEQIIVDLTAIGADMPIDNIIFVAGALKPGSDFAKATNIEFNVYDATKGPQRQIATFWPDLLSTGNAVVIAKAYKHESGVWALSVINEAIRVAQGDFRALLTAAQQHAGIPA